MVHSLETLGQGLLLIYLLDQSLFCIVYLSYTPTVLELCYGTFIDQRDWLGP